MHFVYTDVWASMGESGEQWGHPGGPLLRPYRVTTQLLAASGRSDTKFLHCLPSVHNTDTELGVRVHEQFDLTGAEVSDEVFESPASIVFDQSGNRMHTIKAVLVSALAG